MTKGEWVGKCPCDLFLGNLSPLSSHYASYWPLVISGK
jgi:hypothetical protein